MTWSLRLWMGCVSTVVLGAVGYYLSNFAATTWSGGSITDSSLVDLVSHTKGGVFQLNVLGNSARQAVGTGFLISSDGLIVTNYHVIEDAEAVETVDAKGLKERASCVYGIDVEKDLAILKVDRGFEKPLLLREDLSAIPVGLRVSVIGNPLGLQGSVSEGVVSAIREEPMEGFPSSPLIQLSAPVSPGSSGSPVFDPDGRVLGVVTMASSGAAQNINFAVPVQAVRDLLEKNKLSPCRSLDTIYVDTSFAKPGYDPKLYQNCPMTGAWPDEAFPLGYAEALKAKAWGVFYQINRHLVNRCPTVYFLYTKGAAAAWKIGRKEWAENALLEGVRVCSAEPSSADSRHTLSEATCWEMAGNNFRDVEAYGKAVECYLKATKLDSESVSAWIGLGKALWKNGDIRVAQTAYNNALALSVADLSETSSELKTTSPNSPYYSGWQRFVRFDAYELLGCVSEIVDFYVGTKRVAEARRILEKYTPDSFLDDSSAVLVAEAWAAIGYAMKELGDKGGTVDAFEKALSYWDTCAKFQELTEEDSNFPGDSCDMTAGFGVSYRRALVDALLANGQLDRLQKLLEEMKRRGEINPDSKWVKKLHEKIQVETIH